MKAGFFALLSRLLRQTSCCVPTALFALCLVAVTPVANAVETCPPRGPVAAGSRVTVVYDPGDSSMKACVGSSWVTLAGGGGAANLDGLSDVVITAPALNHALVYDGTNWINGAITVSETDPKVGALTANNWCAANAGGTAIVCNQAAPGGGGSSSGAAGYLQLSGGAGAFASSSTTAGQQLFWDTTNHKLGIGTASPSHPLHVMQRGSYGQVLLGTTGQAGSIGFARHSDATPHGYVGYTAGSDTEFAFRSHGGFGYLRFDTAGAERLRILNNGNVGIGTTAPLSQLHILSTGTSTVLGQLNTSLRLQTISTTSNAGSEILFSGHGGTDAENVYAAISAPAVGNSSGATGGLIFSTKPDHPSSISERMRIDRYGNVGIGTTTPAASALLDISSTTKGLLLPRLTTGQVGAVATPADGLIVYDIDTDTIKLRANGAWASLGGVTPGGANTQVQFNNSGVFGADSNFVWNNTTKRLGLGGVSPTDMLSMGACCVGRNITMNAEYTNFGSTFSGGDVVIGYNARADRASVNQMVVANTHATAGYQAMRMNANGIQFHTKNGAVTSGDVAGNQVMTINTAGSVGVGTASPQALLHLATDTMAELRVDSTGVTNASFANVQSQTDAGRVVLFHNSSGRTGTRWGLSPLAGWGELGAFASQIGAGELQGLVVGVHTSKPLVFGTNNIERMRIDAVGNVGIGTTSPSETLDVNGTVKATTYKGLAGNFTRITATVSSTSTVAWGYSSYVACPAGYTLINWGLANAFSSGAFSGAGVSYHDCNVSGNSVRAAHFTQVVNANFFTSCFGLCVRN